MVTDSKNYNYSDFLDYKFIINGISIDPISGTVFHGSSEIVPIRRKELEVLALLASMNKSIVKREDFIELFWGGNDLVGQSGLTRVITDLRKILKISKSNPIIKTIPRKGYQLTVKAELIDNKKDSSLKSGQIMSGIIDCILERRISFTETTQLWQVKTINNQRKIVRYCMSQKHLNNLILAEPHLKFQKSNLVKKKIY